MSLLKVFFLCFCFLSFQALGSLQFSDASPSLTEHSTLTAKSEVQKSNPPRPFNLLVADNADSYNPFIDYSEFEDSVSEKENILFFQKGRALSLSVFAGYEAVTPTIRQIYGDSPSLIGAAITIFIDLRFALQVSGAFPRSHYNSLLNSSPNFSNAGLDFKYYINKQKLTKKVSEIINPYFIAGPFWFHIGDYNLNNSAPTTPVVPIITSTPTTTTGTAPAADLTSLEGATLQNFQALGLKVGAGLEVSLFKNTFVGLEISYLYTNLDAFENTDLSNLDVSNAIIERNPTSLSTYLFYPPPPQVEGYRFFGDLVQLVISVGINF